MVNIVKQFVLLTKKNLIISWRNKVWSFFELIVPLVCAALIIFIVRKVGGAPEKHPATHFLPVPIFGDYGDLAPSRKSFQGPTADWCVRGGIKKESLTKRIAVVTNPQVLKADAEKLMEAIAARYTRQPFIFLPKYFHNIQEMESTLRTDIANKSHICEFDYVGGVVLHEMNISRAALSYTILMPHLAEGTARWYLDQNFQDGRPYSERPNAFDIPYEPPYSRSGFLTLQKAFGDEFANMTGVDAQNVTLHKFPAPAYMTNAAEALLAFFPGVFAFFMFPTIAHGARELAAEKESGVRNFMRVMGLNGVVFYSSHILFTWVKTLIVCLFCIFSVISMLEFVSSILLIVTVCLFALGAAVFAALCASILDSASGVLKVSVLAWLISSALPLFAGKLRSDLIARSVLWSLNINHAFHYAIDVVLDYCARERQLTFGTMADSWTTSFSFAAALLMIVVDILWMSLAIWFIEELKEGGERFINLFYTGKNALSRRDTKTAGAYDEVDLARQNSAVGIEANALTKIWSSTGEVAVNELNLKAHVNQVTVLLGHNGAGKSTTFSMLCGLVRPTSGTLQVLHEPVGLCPQANALFDKLTVDEHLWFFHELKGSATDYHGQIDTTVHDLHLEEKRNDLAMNLSGGQKRKLCVGMAFIGDSEIVLLDEPTAGMDIEARHEVQDMLCNYKNGRTILLSTHYMDEAERLGDWVYIMYKGRDFANGTTDFLKKKFGTGKVISLAANEDQDVEKLANEVKKMAEDVTGKRIYANVHGRQVDIIVSDRENVISLENTNTNRDAQSREPSANMLAFLQELEKHQAALGYQSFGLSLNTLEQVFLRAGETAAEMDGKAEEVEQVSIEHDVRTEAHATGLVLLARQAVSLLRKRWLYAIRNKAQLFFQVVLPVLILLPIAYLGTAIRKVDTNIDRILSFNNLGPVKTFVQDVTGSRGDELARMSALLNKVPSFVNTVVPSDKNLSSIVERLPKDLPAVGIGAILRSNNRTEALFNGAAYHGAPTALNLLQVAALQQVHSSASITPAVQIYSPMGEEEQKSKTANSAMNMLLGPFLVLSFSILTSALIIFLVDERQCRFSHLQRLTPCPQYLFWTVSFVFDFIVYALCCLVFIFILHVFDWIAGYLPHVMLVFLMFFWASAPFIYLTSFFFTSSSKANTLIMVWQIVTSVTAFILSAVVTFVPTFSEYDGLISNLLMILFPPYAMGSAVVTLSLKAFVGGALSAPSSAMESDQQMSALSALPFTQDVWDWNMLGRPLTMMAISGFFFMTIFLLFQSQRVRRCVFDLWNSRIRGYQKVATDSSHEQSTEVDVDTEAETVKNGPGNYALRVVDLAKHFGKVRAVDCVTFGVPHKQCFGLLGANGAGKTTTFDVITRRTFPTHGKVEPDDCLLGYCPQFDALLLDLTGRETLEILAGLHGYRNPGSKATQVLRRVGMKSKGDKLVRNYSGGQRRRISLAVSLVASAPLVVLDEPTAGVDPKARREIWDHLGDVREKEDSSIMLTSHSMEECEALCTRIGILKTGRLAAIGTSQHLKSKFGNRCVLTIVLFYEVQKENAIDLVAKWFPGSKHVTRSATTLTLKWKIRKEPSDKWSELWGTARQVFKELNAKDFSLTQSSLEETFLTVSGLDHSGESESLSGETMLTASL